MENFALQTSPCSFPKLRISPWGIPFLLLLCFSFPWYFLILYWRPHLLLSLCFAFHPATPFLFLTAAAAAARVGTQAGAASGSSSGAARATAGVEARGSARLVCAHGGAQLRRAGTGSARADPDGGGAERLTSARTRGGCGTREHELAAQEWDRRCAGTWARARAEASGSKLLAGGTGGVDARELRRDGSGQTRTEGSEAEHGGNLARTATEGPATRQGRGECGLGNSRKKSNHAGRRRAER
jgi:hypothetical protein